MNMGEIIPLNDSNVSIQVEPSKKKGKAYYKFIKNNTIINDLEGIIPLKLSPRSHIALKIKKELNSNNRLSKEALASDFETLMQILQQEYESLIILNEKVEKEEKAEKAAQIKNLKEEATLQLKSLNQPLIWIGSIIDWLTAGERNNIYIVFLCYASQVILRNPVSAIGLGDSGSGKSHVQKVAMSLIPDDFIVHEKKITEAALFRRAEKDPYFYDGKIVNYGDMGGEHDLDIAEESKALMKELQTDGYLNKPLNVPSSNTGFEVRDLELFGYPCLTYTTIPGFNFDDQEKSRSIFYTPRMDNIELYKEMCMVLEFRGKTYFCKKEYEKQAELIKYMIYDLRDKLENIEIINPYSNIIADFLIESNYYKRDYPKYNNLLKTVTALGYYNHKIYDNNGQKTMFVTLDDIQFFLSMFDMYKTSINANISLKASEILNILREHLDTWLSSGEKFLIDKGISINDFIEKSKTNLNKRSVQRYFSELNESGYLKVVTKEKNTNYWNLTEKAKTIKKIDLTMNNNFKKVASEEIGNIVTDFYNHDLITKGFNMFLQDENIIKPPWNERR